MLYQKQKECLDILLKGLRTKDHVSQRHLYLSGEMGSGKTYIACAAIHAMHAQKAFVVCPSTVVAKWKQVYLETTKYPEDSVCVYSKRLNNLEYALANPDVHLIIVEQKRLGTALDLLTEREFKKDVLGSISNAFRRTADNYDESAEIQLVDCATHDYRGAVPYLLAHPELSNIDFFVFDEVHGYQPGHLDFSAMFFLLLHSNTPALFLTGTLFNQNVINLFLLLCVTNPQLISSIDHETFYSHVTEVKQLANFGYFDANIWRKIAVKINLGQVKKSDIKQDIMPLTPLKLTPVQSAWLKVATANLNSMERYNLKQIDQKTTAYLDLPSKEQPVLSMTNLHVKSTYQIAMALLPLSPTKTAKFQKLQKILKQSPDQKTIVFAQSKKLITSLSKLLPNSFTLPDRIAKSKRADYINEQFNKEGKSIGIFLPKRISVGVDIYGVQNIIWYQVPDDVAEILQAQRRVVRMDSEDSSRVYFLYYGNTYQEQIIQQVSQSAVHNAADYNVRDDSNLAKVTQILFEGVGEKNAK